MKLGCAPALSTDFHLVPGMLDSARLGSALDSAAAKAAAGTRSVTPEKEKGCRGDPMQCDGSCKDLF